MCVVVLLFFGSCAGIHQGKGSVIALWKIEMIVTTPERFTHLVPLFTLFYNSPYMDVVDMYNILIIPSDSVLWEKTMEASYLVGSFPCQFDKQSVLDIPVWDGVWEQATFGHFCPSG